MKKKPSSGGKNSKPQNLKTLLASKLGPASPGLVHPLTAKERLVAQGILDGWSSKDLAQREGVSVKTIEAHRANISRKLHVHNVAQLIACLLRSGEFTLEGTPTP